MLEKGCFLCEPDDGLRVRSLGSVFVMVGLGPITPTYVMLVGKKHVPSLADLAKVDSKAVAEISHVRAQLEAVCGPLLMTEHGRVPVCRDDDKHEAHCFHGHALLFDLGGRSLQSARNYYNQHSEFSDLKTALEHAASLQSYLLVSKDPSSFEILSDPLNAPRQLARTLVALASGEAWAADWRISPREHDAVAMATSLRASLVGMQ